MDWIRDLDTIAARLDALEDARAGASAELEEIGAMLEARVADAAASVEDSVALSTVAARADENLQLARLALASGEGEVRDARFHLGRAVRYMRELDERIQAGTRESDRLMNQRDFVND